MRCVQGEALSRARRRPQQREQDMTLSVTRRSADELSIDRRSPAYRSDIDGLRALAVLLVVVYHVWLGRVSGGVDVFLMLSAFFLTMSFVRRIETRQPLALGRYWLRTFSRLLPAAVVTIVGVLVVSALVYPPSQWSVIITQSWTSLFYVQNWQLAASAVDYYAPHSGTLSPLQHFWSLSVQGQVFILWPLLFVCVAALVRWTRLTARRSTALVFGLVFVASLIFSIIETQSHQKLAYFDTRTRLWEFALGTLVAVSVVHVRAPGWLRSSLGWIGLAGIISCGLVLDVEGGFPGYLALWPTLAAAAVVFSGAGDAPYGPRRILASRPLTWLGRSAYALYLVHWPILVFALIILDRTELGFFSGLCVILLSLVVARVLSLLIENPTRRWVSSSGRPLRAAVALGVCFAVVAVPLWGWQAYDDRRAERAIAESQANNPGARLLIGAEGVEIRSDAPTLPLPSMHDSQWVTLPESCSPDIMPSVEMLAEACAQNAFGENAERTVLVVGDSHTEQFMGALIPIAEARGWRLISLLKGGCSLGLEVGNCTDWSQYAVDYAIALAPDAVFSVATAAAADNPGETLTPGFDLAARALSSARIPVLAVRDNPRFSMDMYDCALRWGDIDPRCSVELSDALAEHNPVDMLRDLPRVHPIDLSEYICPEGTCPAVTGNVYVYLDNNHLTGTFAETLSPFLDEQLQSVLP